jgi:hypothetical protein
MKAASDHAQLPARNTALAQTSPDASLLRPRNPIEAMKDLFQHLWATRVESL